MNSILSDINRPGYRPSVYTDAVKLYSDLDLSFDPHPLTGDILPLTDIDAVKNSIKSLVQTEFFERPFQPNVGSRIRSLLFENVDQFLGAVLRDEIENLISTHEPRISDVNVEVQDQSEQNSYGVSITFTIVYSNTQSSVDFVLNQLR